MTGDTLAIGLQEWAACCAGLLDGRLVLAVRKGGIQERRGGLFTPEHRRFCLLPTWLHQDRERLARAYWSDLGQPPASPVIPVAGWCEIMQVWRLTDLDRLLGLGEDLAWTAEELERRFRYREPGLQVLALRSHRLTAPVSLPDEPAYALCRSWITLKDSVPLAGSTPVLDEGAFADRLDRLTIALAT